MGFITKPAGYQNPNWQDEFKDEHEWMQQISHDLREMWAGFTDQQKRAIAENAVNVNNEIQSILHGEDE